MKFADIKNKKPAELEKSLNEMKKELFTLKSASLAGEDSLKKKARVKSVKRDIARIKTLLNKDNQQ